MVLCKTLIDNKTCSVFETDAHYETSGACRII